MMKNWFQRIVSFVERWNSLEGSLFPYALTASFVMALPPVLVVLVMMFASKKQWMIHLFQILKRFFPEDLMMEAFEYLFANPVKIPLLIPVGIAVVLVSKSPMHFLMMNQKEHKTHINPILLRLFSIWITLEMFGILFLGILLIQIVQISAFVASEVLLFVGLYWFYRSVSLRRNRWQDELVGTSLAFLGINGIGIFFFFYVNQIASTHLVYGPLASLVIVLLSCFAISNVIFFGYCINEEFRKTKECKPHYPRIERLGERIWKC